MGAHAKLNLDASVLDVRDSEKRCPAMAVIAKTALVIVVIALLFLMTNGPHAERGDRLPDPPKRSERPSGAVPVSVVKIKSAFRGIEP